MRSFQLTFPSVLAVVFLCLFAIGEAKGRSQERHRREEEVGENLALGRQAWQRGPNGRLDIGNPGYAVDGNNSSCTATSPGEALDWWAVDLGDVYSVSLVTITGGYVDERLPDFNIALMTSPPNEVEPGPDVYDVIYHQTEAAGAGETVSFATDDVVSGRYLVIQLLNSDTQSLCEIQVSGRQAPVCEVSDENIALDQPTWQTSSTRFRLVKAASLAVDGHDNPEDTYSCAYTLYVDQPWWAVDLGDVYRVYSVTITTGTLLYRDTLSDFNIALMSSPPDEVTPAPGVYDVIYYQSEPMAYGEAVTFPSNDDTLSGRYLVIQQLSARSLTLCEVNVTACA